MPRRRLEDARLQRTAPLTPIALLAALVATQTFANGHRLVLDARPFPRGGDGRGRPAPG